MSSKIHNSALQKCSVSDLNSRNFRSRDMHVIVAIIGIATIVFRSDCKVVEMGTSREILQEYRSAGHQIF